MLQLKLDQGPDPSRFSGETNAMSDRARWGSLS